MRPLLRNVLGPGIEKRFELDDAMMPVMADPTQLEVAVLNLAINARDAMPDGGVLSFASRPRARSPATPKSRTASISSSTISDTGVGMPPEVLERAFEPFFTTKEVGKGTGLGLSMVYGMARQSGGGARIESTPGQGTAVRLLFRTADGADRRGGGRRRRAGGPGRGPRPPVDPGHRRRPRRARFIVASLEEQGYQGPPGRATAAKAWGVRPRQARPGRSLDFIMPGLSGADVAHKLLARRPGQPILFVSGYSETEAVQPHRARRPAAGQAVPRRRARARGQERAGRSGVKQARAVD